MVAGTRQPDGGGNAEDNVIGLSRSGRSPVQSQPRPTTAESEPTPPHPRARLHGVKMSGRALKDLNVSQSADLENGKDNSVKSCITKPVLNGNKCANKEEKAPSACHDAVTNGNAAAIADVEYIDSENLVDLPDVDAALSDVVGIKEYGMDKLIQIAATQLSDQLPESREAARNLALELQAFYEKSQASTSDEHEVEASASPDAESWEAFCQSKLSALSAQAILRVTSTTTKECVTSAPKEGLAVGC
ncbi:hypothetical protein Zm00014a_024333 [Zea mays]|uniref:Uncharacterized protein n=1 Tax=Zea mays TaxID=4577 RepID=A0A3L6FD65_MAIZE|nr:hypothetical protein Zm00014a_024333 [Zea mays]